MSIDKKYVKVKIEGIFNLEEFSQKYEMTPTEVVSFHNSHCRLQELLTLTLPKYIEYVYVPSKNYRNRDLQVLKSTILDLPANNTEKTYGVIIKFLPKELQMHYEITVKRTAIAVELVKAKTYVNNQEIDQTIEQLFEKAEQVLYPLQLSLTRNGGLNKILNSEQISNRWKNDCRPKLAEYYHAETADEILSKLDKAFENVDAKRELLNRTLFYKLFFLPVYTSYRDFTKQDFLKIFFSSISSEVYYNLFFKLEKEFTRGNKIALRLDGEEEENIFNTLKKRGKIELLYKFNRETLEVFSITGTMSAFENDIENVIEFQMYELENNH